MRRPAHILLGFCTDKRDWISRLICWATWSPFAHVVLVSPYTAEFIEATHGKGVVLGSLAEFLGRDGVELRCIPHHDPAAVWARALSQVGKPYDWRFLWALIARRDWQDPSAWACSELIAWAAEIYEPEFVSCITPRDLHLVSKPIANDERAAP